MRVFTQAVFAGALLLMFVAAAPPAGAVGAHRWEVTIAIRIEGGDPDPMSLRLALPSQDPGRRITGLELTPRGLKAELRRDEDGPSVLFTGSARTSRRIAATFIVDSRSFKRRLPRIVPAPDPSIDVLPYLVPGPLFQSRSLLVREFLEFHVGPVVKSGETDLFRAIYEATRSEIAWQRDGKSLPLDVIRRRHGKRIGIERAFTTFLRCAGIPARFVEGINLESTTKQKRVFWTELWVDDRWWPVSASRGWIGRLPASYVALARNGRRVLEMEGPVTASYLVHGHRLEEDGEGDA